MSFLPVVVLWTHFFFYGSLRSVALPALRGVGGRTVLVLCARTLRTGSGARSVLRVYDDDRPTLSMDPVEGFESQVVGDSVVEVCLLPMVVGLCVGSVVEVLTVPTLSEVYGWVVDVLPVCTA